VSTEKLKMIAHLIIEHHNLLHLILTITAGYVKKKPERWDQESGSYKEELSLLQNRPSYCKLTLQALVWFAGITRT